MTKAHIHTEPSPTQVITGGIPAPMPCPDCIARNIASDELAAALLEIASSGRVEGWLKMRDSARTALARYREEIG